MIILLIMEVRQIIDHTDLDGDIDSVYHHGAVLGRGPSVSAGRAGVRDLKDSNDLQLVQRRSAAVQNHPLACGLMGIQRCV